MKTFKKTLIELDACEEAMIWICDKDFKTFYETCERGDWLLWLYARTNKEDLKGLILAKAHCAAYAASYAAAASAAKTLNQQLTTDICRKYLPIENFNINFRGLS